MQLLVDGRDTTTVATAARNVATELSIHHSVVSEVVNLAIETRVADGDDYAVRDIDAFTAIAPGEAKQFDADISGSLWVALIGTAAGAGSTVSLSVLMRKVTP